MLQKIVHILHRAEEGLLAFLLAAMALVTFSQVVARYVFNTGVIWALELTTFLFAWLILMGMSYGIRIHTHIGVDAFVRIFNPPIQRLLGLVAIIAGLLYAGMLLFGSWEQVSLMFEIDMESEDLKVPLWVPLSVLIIGFILMIVRLLVIAWRILVYKESGLLLGDEGRDAIEQFSVDDTGGDNDNAKLEGPEK